MSILSDQNSSPDLRKRLIEHILNMKTLDIDYARFALARYHAELPWLDLLNGVKEAMK